MTTDQALREAKARWARRRRRLIGYGQWQPFVDAEPARQHVLAIRATGMGLRTLATHAGVTVATLDHLIYGKPNSGKQCPPAVRIRVENAEALLAYWPKLDDYDDRSVIDATATRRRMQALAAIGWPVTAIHQHIDFITLSSLERLRFNQQCTARVARAVRGVYAWAATGKAEDYGITAWIAERARKQAASRVWAPPSTWDDDRIADPNATPDWTGHCGSDRGWWLHRLEGIPTCPPCETAHQQWKTERAHLSASERWAELGQARANARTREADLAHDARELIRYGADTEQAAARLGVTRQHLQQALLRHPQTETELAA